jgi:predicted nucleotidyltransferase
LDLLEAAGFDMELAGAELLGRDVAAICSPAALARIQLLIESEPDVERLTHQMIHSAYLEAEPALVRMIGAFRRGILTEL